MAVDGIGYIAKMYAAGTSETTNTNSNIPVKSDKSGSEININDFFKLMIAQLQNQSMDDTVDNSQFITQMAQFSTLSQMNELTKSTKSNMAVAMIGKTVSVSLTDASGIVQTKTGEVEKVSFFDNQPYIYLDGKYYEFSQITDITK